MAYCIEASVAEMVVLPCHGSLSFCIGWWAIIFPKGMVTQQGKELPLRQGMQAMVEVVTDERRLIELLLPLSRE